MDIYYKGEVGRIISQTTEIDWTGNATKQVLVIKPSGETVTKTAADVVVDDATTGQIHIVTASNDIDETGEYMMQAKFTTATATTYCPMTSFIVEDVLVAAT